MPALYHHYWKPVSLRSSNVCCSNRRISALLTDIGSSVAKFIARASAARYVNESDHDHDAEIATGRVQVRDMPQAQAKILQRSQQNR